MKKLFLIILLNVFLISNANALGSELLNMRNKLSEDSRQIKAQLLESRNIILMSSMWDSCVLTMTQLEAYFFMIAIVNTIETEDMKGNTVEYMINWLNIIKNTNDLNLKSLDMVIQTLEPKTQVCKERLKKDFGELKKLIDAELAKLIVMKRELTISPVNPPTELLEIEKSDSALTN